MIALSREEAIGAWRRPLPEPPLRRPVRDGTPRESGARRRGHPVGQPCVKLERRTENGRRAAAAATTEPSSSSPPSAPSPASGRSSCGASCCAPAPGETFCGFGGARLRRAVVGAFAATVHALTGVPVAGWGLVWGAVATVLPLLAWSGPAGSGRGPAPAIELTALAGVAGVAVLLAASAAEGLFCKSCAAHLRPAGLYAAVTWRASGPSRVAPRRAPRRRRHRGDAWCCSTPGSGPRSSRSGSEALAAAAAHEPVAAHGPSPPPRRPAATGAPDRRSKTSSPACRRSSAGPRRLPLALPPPPVTPEEPRVMAAGRPGRRS